MLDKRFIVENPELVQTSCDQRGVKVDIARFCELETARRRIQQEIEQLNREANLASKSIGKATSQAEREACKAEGRRLREAKEVRQAELQRLEVDEKFIILQSLDMKLKDVSIIKNYAIMQINS